jgi:hypothetical protein
MAENLDVNLPEPTGLNALTHYVVQRMDPYAEGRSTAGRIFLETTQGKNLSAITAKDYKPEELQALRDIVEQASKQKRNYVTYDDYQSGLLPGLHDPFSPKGNIRSSLGRFKYSRNSDGSLNITDNYDFNPAGNSPEPVEPYHILRNYAGERVPPGYGRRVNITVPPGKPTPPETKVDYVDKTINSSVDLIRSMFSRK